MYKVLISFVILIMPHLSFARTGFRGCCSHHGGVSFCDGEGNLICLDGRPSPSCGCINYCAKLNNRTNLIVPDFRYAMVEVMCCENFFVCFKDQRDQIYTKKQFNNFISKQNEWNYYNEEATKNFKPIKGQFLKSLTEPDQIAMTDVNGNTWVINKNDYWYALNAGYRLATKEEIDKRIKKDEKETMNILEKTLDYIKQQLIL